MKNVYYSDLNIIDKDKIKFIISIPKNRVDEYCPFIDIYDLDKENRDHLVKLALNNHRLHIEGKLHDLQIWGDGAWWDRIKDDLVINKIIFEDNILWLMV